MATLRSMWEVNILSFSCLHKYTFVVDMRSFVAYNCLIHFINGAMKFVTHTDGHMQGRHPRTKKVSLAKDLRKRTMKYNQNYKVLMAVKVKEITTTIYCTIRSGHFPL